MNWTILTSIIILAFSLNPCCAQESNVRVINQSNNGLAYPSSSYIGPGTISKTAQEGAGYRSTNNPTLPKVNHGGYFGTPGDNLYSGNPDLSRHPQNVNVQRPIRFVRQQVPKEKPNIYTPDPKIPMNYSDYKPESFEDKDNNSMSNANENATNDKNTSTTKN